MVDRPTGSSILDYLPTLISGASNVVGLTYGQAQNLPQGTIQLTGSSTYGGPKVPVQTAPPINWLPILAVGTGLILLAIWSRGKP